MACWGFASLTVSRLESRLSFLLSLRASRCSSVGRRLLPVRVSLLFPFVIESFTMLGCCAGFSQPVRPKRLTSHSSCSGWKQRLGKSSRLSCFVSLGSCTGLIQVVDPLVLPKRDSWSRWGQAAGEVSLRLSPSVEGSSCAGWTQVLPLGNTSDNSRSGWKRGATAHLWHSNAYVSALANFVMSFFSSPLQR